MHSTQVRKYASTQVRKYASTLKTSAILIAGLVGLWLGLVGTVSAKTGHPYWGDCVVWGDALPSGRRPFKMTLVTQFWGVILEVKENKITIDEFDSKMNNLLTRPDSINCTDDNGTIAYYAVAEGSIAAAKWAVSKDIDLTIRSPRGGRTAYEDALGIAKYWSRSGEHVRSEIASQISMILRPPATKSCAEVEGKSPLPDWFDDIELNEYCIVAENTQESFKARLVVPGFDGYEHKTTAVSSGVGFRKDWKSTITFTCRAPTGQSCEGLPYADDPLGPGIDADNFELYVRCGNTINLLDVDSIDGGKSETIDVIEVTNEYPYSRNCTAKSSQPFTLSIKTTRLAK